MTRASNLRNELSKHHGSQCLFQHGINPGFLYTEGVQCFAEEAGAYWFLDIAATEIWEFCLSLEFATIILAAHGDGYGYIRIEDGNGGVLWSKKIPYTNCPEGEWMFFYLNNTLILPSEY